MKKTFPAGGFHDVPSFDVEVEPTDLVTSWGPPEKLWSMHVDEYDRVNKRMCGMSDCLCGSGLRAHSVLDQEHLLIHDMSLED